MNADDFIIKFFIRPYQDRPQSFGAVIYGLREKSSNQYFYIGSSRVSAKARFSSHLSGAKTDKASNKHLSRKIRKIGVDNVVYDTIERVTIPDQFSREYFWINKFRLTNLKLTPEPVSAESYEEKLRNPANVLRWLDIVESGPGVALDARSQHLVDQLHRVSVLYLKRAEACWDEVVKLHWSHLPSNLVELFRQRIQALPLSQ